MRTQDSGLRILYSTLKMLVQHSVAYTAAHYSDIIMSVMVAQITSLMIVCSTVYSGTDQRKHQSSASLAFVRGIHQWLVNSPYKRPITWKMFPLDDVIMSDQVRINIIFWTHKRHLYLTLIHELWAGHWEYFRKMPMLLHHLSQCSLETVSMTEMYICM